MTQTEKRQLEIFDVVLKRWYMAIQVAMGLDPLPILPKPRQWGVPNQ